MPETYSLRQATPDDLSQILEIERKSFKLPWTKEAFNQELAKPYSHFLVLTDDETDQKIAGYIVYWLIFEECHILNLAIEPSFRGQGYAKRLVRHCIELSIKNESKRVFLEVRKSNTAAVSLYTKLRFYIDHIKPRFYEDSEDAYFMCLNLHGKYDS